METGKEFFRYVATLGALAMYLSCPLYPPALGQASVSGRISGTVTDVTGAVIRAAQVRARNLTTNDQRSTVSGDLGIYEFLNVPIGRYELAIEAPGFKKEVTEVEVQVQSSVVVNFRLNVGEVSEQVLVTGAAEVLRTTDATISGVVDNVRLSDLPLNGRSFTDLIGLQPGATPVLNTGAGARTSDTRNAGGFVNGADDFFNDFTIDGGDYNDLVVPGSSINKALIGTGVPPDAIQEFHVVTSNESAEFGTVAGAHIAVVTKSGSNALHSTLWEYVRNNAFDARNFFDRGLFYNDNSHTGHFVPGVDTARTPPFRLNQFGLVVGGPIRKDKDFFFGSYEGYRQALLQTATPLVPTPRLIDALPSGQAYGNLRELFRAFFPPPDPGYSPTALVAPLGTVTDVSNHRNSFIVRTDHVLTLKDRLSFRIVFNKSDGPPGALLSTGIRGGNIGFTWQNEDPQITDTRIVSPNMVNEFRMNFNRHELGTVWDTPLGPVTSLGYSASAADRNGVPLIVSSGTGLANVGILTSIPQGRAVNVFQYNDTLSNTAGRHSMKMGANIFRYQSNQYGADTPRPQTTFVGFGAPFDSQPNGLTSGAFFTQTQTFNINPLDSSHRYVRYSHFGFFYQDNFRVSPKFTLDLGVRYEFFSVPYEKNGVQNTLFQLDAGGNALPGTRVTDITHVSLFRTDGKPLRIMNTDYKNVAPRVGLAWTPLERLVLRAGYGISYNRPDLFGFGGTANYPFSIPTSLSGQRFGTFADPNQFLNRPQNVTAFDPANVTTYVQKYNLNLQFKLDSQTYYQVGYVGSHTLNLPLNFNPNYGGGYRGTRPNQNFLVISIREQTGQTHYNALQMEVFRRYNRGLSLQVSYTYSKAIGMQEQFSVPTDLFNANVDRGPMDFDLRHMLIVNGVYDLPVGKGHRLWDHGVVNTIFGQWSMASLFWVRSGQPFSIDSGVDINGDGNATDRARLLAAVPGSTLLNSGDKAQYLKARSDVLNTILSQSNVGAPLGRNTFTGPGSVNCDLSLLKNIPIKERAKFQLRFEFFNVFNHTNLNNPVQTLGSPAFGQILSTRTNSRQIQFAAKLYF